MSTVFNPDVGKSVSPNVSIKKKNRRATLTYSYDASCFNFFFFFVRRTYRSVQFRFGRRTRCRRQTCLASHVGCPAGRRSQSPVIVERAVPVTITRLGTYRVKNDDDNDDNRRGQPTFIYLFIFIFYFLKNKP